MYFNDIFGDDGNNELIGTTGNDRFFSGNGTPDILSGGLGNDAYVFTYGDGTNIIRNADDATGSGFDKIVMGADVDPSTVWVDFDGGDLVLTLTAPVIADRVYIRVEDAYTVTSNSFSFNDSAMIDMVQFADGTIWRPWKLEQIANIPSSTLDDEIFGTQGDDTMSGLGGRDTVYGLAGNNTLTATDGTDKLYGGTGDDTLLALYETTPNLFYQGFTNRLYGEEGNDILIAREGSTLMDGGTGDDTYIIEAGVRNVELFSAATDTPENDRIVFGAGINPEDISYGSLVRDGSFGSQYGYGYLDVGGDNNFRVDLGEHENFSAFPQGDPLRIAEIEFDDGTIWDSAYLAANLFGPTDGDDVRVLTDEGETITNGAGDDRVYARGGDDILIGDLGDDVLYGGRGNDTYMLNVGHGNDTINNDDGDNTGFDKIIFGAGIDPNDVTVSRVSERMTMTVGSIGDGILLEYGTDSVLLANHYTTLFEENRRRGTQIDEIEFDDGTIWTRQTIEALGNAATEGNNVLEGTSGDDVINGLGGDDRIDANPGNDILIGGRGNDILIGDQGDDVFLFSLGDGEDRIPSSATGFDTIRFTAGITPDDVTVSANFQSLEFSYGTGDVITAVNYFVTPTLIDQVEFDDGTIWTPSFFEGLAASITAGDDRIYGTTGNDWITPMTGSDVIIGRDGNDTVSFFDMTQGITADLAARRVEVGEDTNEVYLIQNLTGSVHADYIAGDDGANTLRGLGGGDWFVATAGGDTYDGGTSKDAVSYINFNQGVTIALDGTAPDHPDSFTSIENLTGSSYDDVITGDAGRNTLRGMFGEDQLFGGGGVDRLEGGKSDDMLDGGTGWDRAVFSGDMANYTITTNGAVTTVRDTIGRDGTDTLVNIELLVFADDTFAL